MEKHLNAKLIVKVDDKPKTIQYDGSCEVVKEENGFCWVKTEHGTHYISKEQLTESNK